MNNANYEADYIAISVVIPTYNRSELLSYTLNSLYNQTVDRYKFEVIVVDDGGTDEATSGVINEYRGKLNLNYFWQEDKGFRPGAARNLGINNAKGKYILFIDTGIILSTTALEYHLELHENSQFPTVVIGYVHAFEISDEQVDKLLPCVNPNDTDKCITLAKKQKAYDIREQQYDALGDDIHFWPAPFDIFWTCHVSVVREEVIKVGCFDSSCNTWGGEDVDLGIKLFNNGNCYYMNRKISSFHWPHTNQINKKSKSAEAGLRLHHKYQMWQTSYYEKMNIDCNHHKFSLNAAIKYMGPIHDNNNLNKFMNW
ncbi:MAG: glycosyltransferase [bacterium]|nr:glycosyltransferase [bacterium]